MVHAKVGEALLQLLLLLLLLLLIIEGKRNSDRCMSEQTAPGGTVYCVHFTHTKKDNLNQLRDTGQRDIVKGESKIRAIPPGGRDVIDA